MYSIWSEDSAQIDVEIKNIIAEKRDIFFLHQKTKKMLPVTAKRIVHNGQALFVADRPSTIKAFPKSSIFCYVSGKKTMRGFKAALDSKTPKRTYFQYPPTIFDIQRRRSLRAPTSKESLATFFFMNASRVNTGVIEDISAQGIKITTDIPIKVSKGDVISPLTLENFYERFYTSKNFRLQIPEARVSWALFNGIRTTKMGIKFTLPEVNLPTLNDYLDIRSKEMPQ